MSMPSSSVPRRAFAWPVIGFLVVIGLVIAASLAAYAFRGPGSGFVFFPFFGFGWVFFLLFFPFSGECDGGAAGAGVGTAAEAATGGTEMMRTQSSGPGTRAARSRRTSSTR